MCVLQILIAIGALAWLTSLPIYFTTKTREERENLVVSVLVALVLPVIALALASLPL